MFEILQSFKFLHSLLKTFSNLNSSMKFKHSTLLYFLICFNSLYYIFSLNMLQKLLQLFPITLKTSLMNHPTSQEKLYKFIVWCKAGGVRQRRIRGKKKVQTHNKMKKENTQSKKAFSTRHFLSNN